MNKVYILICDRNNRIDKRHEYYFSTREKANHFEEELINKYRDNGYDIDDKYFRKSGYVICKKNGSTISMVIRWRKLDQSVNSFYI